MFIIIFLIADFCKKNLVVLQKFVNYKSLNKTNR